MKQETNNNPEKKPVEKFTKYGIENCDWCGEWPAAYTPLEDATLCTDCLDEAMVNYQVSVIKGTNKI